MTGRTVCLPYNTCRTSRPCHQLLGSLAGGHQDYYDYDYGYDYDDDYDDDYDEMGERFFLVLKRKCSVSSRDSPLTLRKLLGGFNILENISRQKYSKTKYLKAKIFKEKYSKTKFIHIKTFSSLGFELIGGLQHS